MIIDNEKKYIFVAVPKTASTTIHKILGHLNNSSHEFLQEKYHYPITNILKEHPYALDYFKFGFARNPWDRIYSSWLEFTTRKDHLNTWSSDLPKEFKTFEEFCLNLKNSKWSTEIHFFPSAHYLFFNDRPLNFIGRYETFREDLQKLFLEINQELNFEKLPITRKTDRDQNYRIYYTNDKMIQSIADFYKLDIEKFSYDF